MFSVSLACGRHLVSPLPIRFVSFYAASVLEFYKEVGLVCSVELSVSKFDFFKLLVFLSF